HNLPRLRVGALTLRRNHLANPRHERRGRGHLIAEVRELQMRVRVDEAGQDHHVPEIQIAPPTPRPRPPERDDAAAVDRHPPVSNGRPADRKHPGGAVANQSSRSVLPLRLRAGYRRSSAGTEWSPSSRAVTSSSIRGTSRSRNTGSPRIS